MAAKIWVVGSGKGGVGKTFIASNLGITLSKLDKKVLLVDLDLSGANLHTNLGLPHVENNLSLFWSGDKKLKELILPTQLPRLSYVQGHWNQWASVEMDVEKGRQLMKEARDLPYDFIILDLGPGATDLHLEMFHSADQKFLVVNPEPTSVEKTYRFFEALIASTLKQQATPEAYVRLLKAMGQYRSKHSAGLFSFREYLHDAVGFQFNYFDQLDQNPVRLIVNQSRSQQDRDLGHSIQSVCYKFYDLPLKYLGAIDYDNAAWQSLRSRRPVLIDKPFTPLAGQYLSMCKELTQTDFTSQFLKAVV